MENRWGNYGNSDRFFWGGYKITEDDDCSHEIKRCLLFGRKAMTKLDSVFKSKKHQFADNGPPRQSYIFSSSHVWMWVLDHKEGWVLKKLWCVESSLYCKIKPVNPKGNQSSIFIGKTDVEAVTPILWPHNAKNWLIGKDPDAGWERLKVGGEGDDRGWDGWMASLTLWTWVRVGSRSWWWTGKPGMLESMGYKELDTTEQLSWTELKN